jgi:DeoR/GlpR family transcriptional regulator of sugar metabolism
MRPPQAALYAAFAVIVITDYTQCGRVSVAFVALIHVVDTLITDSEIASQLAADFAMKGIRVLTA